MLTNLLFIAADTVTQSPEHIAAYQQICMRRLIDPGLKKIRPKKRQNIPTMFRDSTMIADHCSWDGVHCTAGVVDGLLVTPEEDIFAFNMHTCAVVDMDWLPPTLVKFTLEYVYTHTGWATHMLPRELRFLLMRECWVRTKGRPKRFVDLNRLPHKMEELHLFNTPLYGSIRIARLPETMRIVDIAAREGHTAKVYFEGLPKSLQSMVITLANTYGKGIKLVGIGERQADPRVTSEVKSDERSKGISSYKDMFPERAFPAGLGDE